MWKGKPLEKIWRKIASHQVALHLGTRVQALSSDLKRVVDGQGMAHTYDRLLLATGGTPRRLPFGGDQILYYRTVEDYRHLRAQASQHRRFAVIGGGFIGSEIAAALTMNGNEVTMLFPEEGIGALTFPPDLARFLNEFYRTKDVNVLAGAAVTDLEAREGGIAVMVQGANRTGEQEVVVDGVSEPYHHLPFFYSDLFELGYEAVGQVDARLDTFVDWQEPNRKGVIYYLQDDRVRGVLLWNVWDQVGAARQLIAASDRVEPEELRGRLPAVKLAHA